MWRRVVNRSEWCKSVAMGTTRSNLRYLSTHNPVSYLSQANVSERVQGVVANYVPTTAKPSDHFVATLGLDRVAVSKIIQELSTEFCVNISYQDANRITSLETATEYFSSHPKAR